MAKRPIARATFQRLATIETDECIEWPHYRDARGYGRLHVPGLGTRGAHRIACELRHGPRPDGMQAAHSCNNPACINYRHLRWATPTENMDDMVKAGRSTRGARNTQTKMTVEQVRAIRQRRSQGATSIVLADEFGTTSSNIRAICTRATWAWLDVA